ncbi:tetratricopeptide repeat protein [Cryptosporangium phraense]|uniref:tetratricopeptide repeat protein n=1 Tax=Cryptosporangium phraense TaxID=2593070 RepID=UPI001478BAED|nr:sel1 repeat family protein [Cryptosporangium phraense]
MRRRSPEERYREGRRLDLLGHEGPSTPLYEEAAAAGYGPACNELGKQRIRAGRTIEGLQWLRKAVEAGVPEASLNLAAVYTRRGQAAKASEYRDRAEPGLRAAADAGDLTAALGLRRLYRDRGDADAADAVLASARAHAETSPDPDVWCAFGALLDDAERVAEAVEWWRRAAEAGHPEAMYLLGLGLHDLRDPAAEEWLERAARSENAYAMGSLAQLALARGDEGTGERWLRRAAKAGFSGAMTNLAVLYRERGDTAAAVRWYTEAMNAGDPNAEHELQALVSGS